ncbi:MAG: hypothetical protein IKZ88_08785 [Neisseriaceae bacterium]|nr:hypothetical protein [Neisseriaceae bacterium]
MGLSWFSGCLKGLSVFIFNSVHTADAIYIFRLPENYFCRYGGQECPPYNDTLRCRRWVEDPPYGACFSSSFFAFSNAV